MFKTEKRGWGIRTLNDIPAGGFICIYVGNLYSNDEANRQGQDFGDEYFAELDMIESVEGRKEGYESDVDEGKYKMGRTPGHSKIGSIGRRYCSSPIISISYKFMLTDDVEIKSEDTCKDETQEGTNKEDEDDEYDVPNCAK